MEIKKNLKRFLTLSRRHDGFTLVELIVVIAILAILAGIAVPAYSGYIKKANQAADLQLLGAVNTAFSAAMVANGVNAKDLGTAEIGLDADMKVTGITKLDGQAVTSGVTMSAVAMTETLANACNDSFVLFFKGNGGAAFKVIVELKFNPADGTFYGVDEDGNSIGADDDSEGGTTITGPGTYTYKGITVTVSQKQYDTLMSSNYAKMGAEDLLANVASVSDLCSGMVGNKKSSLFALVNDPEYLETLASSLDMDTTALNKKLSGMTSDAKFDYLANSLVLVAAKESVSMDETASQALLNSLSSSEGMTLTKPENTSDIAELASIYALYTAYAAKNGGSSTDIENFDMFSTAVTDEGFRKYAATDEAAADLQAYLTAMTVVSDATGNGTATDTVLTNGFSDPELSALLVSIMGNGTSGSTSTDATTGE